jgi:dUTP pyrophosphatase
MNELLFVKIRDDAVIPSKRNEDAGYDIYPSYDANGYYVLNPHETKLLPTGLISVIPQGYYVQIHERGSTGAVGLKYGAGVIDSGYRDEWFIAITNVNDYTMIISKTEEDYTSALVDLAQEDATRVVKQYKPGKAIAQAVVHKVHEMTVREISEAELENYKSERGKGSLGSSGK